MSKGQRHFYSLYLGLSTYSAFMAPSFKYFEQMAWNNNTIITKVVSIGRQGADAKNYKGRVRSDHGGVSVMARVILKHWKTPKIPELKEWINIMTKTAAYERLLYKLHNKNKAEVSVRIPVWEDFWSYISLSFHVTQ